MATIEAGDRITIREPKDGYEVVYMDYKHKQAIVKTNMIGVHRRIPFNQILEVKKSKREMLKNV